MAELETIIQFQLIILQNAKALKEEERKYLFKFIREKRAHLYLVGINFELSNNSSAAIRYANTVAEIRKLTPDKQTLFNALKLKFIEEEREKQYAEDLVEEREAQKDEERQNNLSKMSDAKKALIAKLDANPNMPIDEMPDCRRKLIAIRKDCLENTKKYTDVQWDHMDETKLFGANMTPPIEHRAIIGW